MQQVLPIQLGSDLGFTFDSFAENVTRSIREQSRALMGGDVSFSSRRPYTDEQNAILDTLRTTAKAEYARVVTFPSMALVPRSGATRLAQIRAVSPNFPFYGEITTNPAGKWRELHNGPNALVDPSLLIALNARVGDTIILGLGRFVISGTLQNVPLLRRGLADALLVN